MKRWLLATAVMVGMLALAACAGEEKATPAPSPTGAARPAADREWAQLVQAAKREGKVAIISSFQGDAPRRAFTEAFQKKYGITVEYLGASGPSNTARLKTERGAGQYLWDIMTAGSAPFVDELKAIGAFDPVEPALILPDVKETKNWKEGRLEFVDKERLVLAMSTYSMPAFVINTQMVKPEEFKSYKDLLDPKWRGKMVTEDPSVGGAGQAQFTFYLQHKDLGVDFIRNLAAQKLQITRDQRQASEWVAKGSYPICVGCTPHVAREFMREGLPVAYVNPRQLKEGGWTTSGAGNVMLMNRPAHPNAAKLYLNWLLSKEGQTELNPIGDFASRRVDVPAPSGMEASQASIEGFWPAYTPDRLKQVFAAVPAFREAFPD